MRDEKLNIIGNDGYDENYRLSINANHDSAIVEPIKLDVLVEYEQIRSQNYDYLGNISIYWF